MNHGQVAAKVRAHKEAHPELYCLHPGCLWRIKTSAPNSENPCRNHPKAATATPAQTDVTAVTADPKNELRTQQS